MLLYKNVNRIFLNFPKDHKKPPSAPSLFFVELGTCNSELLISPVFIPAEAGIQENIGLNLIILDPAMAGMIKSLIKVSTGINLYSISL